MEDQSPDGSRTHSEVSFQEWGVWMFQAGREGALGVNWFDFLRHWLDHGCDEWVIQEMTSAGWREHDARSWITATRAGRTRPMAA
jgi:hypothetical protein